MTDREPDERVFVSCVAQQPHAVLTHASLGSSVLILRMPEFVATKTEGDELSSIVPRDVRWEVVEPDVHLRYVWQPDAETRRLVGLSLCGEIRGGDGEMTFEVTVENTSQGPASFFAHLFCLQCGGNRALHDYEGERTHLWCVDRWRMVRELRADDPLSGKRMTGWRVIPGATAADAVSERLMIRQPRGDSDLVIGIATDIADSVSSNHQFWPSCIHSNPGWKELAPGENQTARGKVYIFHGTKDEMLERYRRDFD